MESHEYYAPFAVTVTMPHDQFEALVGRVAERLQEGRDDGFVDVAGAAEYLATTPKGIYRAVERGRLPYHRAGRRLLFDRAELRAYVESG
jgi:excisionase family DNA binding protein